jgi:hypothetical protein
MKLATKSVRVRTEAGALYAVNCIHQQRAFAILYGPLEAGDCLVLHTTNLLEVFA